VFQTATRPRDLIRYIAHLIAVLNRKNEGERYQLKIRLTYLLKKRQVQTTTPNFSFSAINLDEVICSEMLCLYVISEDKNKCRVN
jgi:hypothetical protein